MSVHSEPHRQAPCQASGSRGGKWAVVISSAVRSLGAPVSQEFVCLDSSLSQAPQGGPIEVLSPLGRAVLGLEHLSL